MNVIHSPQRILHLLVDCYSYKLEGSTNIITGMKIEGRSFFSSTLVNGSNTEYETKKIDRAALYIPGVIPRSLSRWAIFAFPIFVLSKNDRRYRMHSYMSG